MVALTVGAGYTIIGISPAKADFAPSAAFDAYAQGIAVNATARNQSFPLGVVIEGIGPEASSRLTSSGQSDAEASFPYLGPVVPGLPGIAAGLYGLPSPGYPLQAATGAGDAPADVAYPGIRLHAESGQESNIGSASVVSPSGGGTADSRISVAPSGDVRAFADSALDGIVIGGTVRMSGVHSTAVVLADGTTGKLTRSSSLSIARIHVPGLAIAVPKTTPGSAPVPVPIPGVPQLPDTPFPPIPLPFGGQTLPAPDIGFKDGYFSMTLPGFGDNQYAVPASSVLDAFKQAGYGITYQPATETPTGIEGASFNFTYEAPGFPDNPYFSGPVPITYTVGKVLANVTLNPATYDATAGVTDSAAAGTGSVGTGAAGAAPGGVLPSLDAAGIGGLVPGGAAVGAAPAAVGAGVGTGIPTATFVPAGAAINFSDSTNLYLLFAAIAVAALLSMMALSLVGVRSPWKS
ncbi:hypothetical protein [Sporichthya polymorpha]|uniref:hypothetical protein n=1 Tax=Sporichthya polymorpha TaxID=35751 RepID=UPI0003A29A7D|nr:hypothetical protein [Sporichthya polymorpha]